MAVDKIAYSASARVVVNKGTDPSTGKKLTGSVSIPGVRAEATAEKVYGVAAALGPCLANTVERVLYTETSELEQD